MKIFLTSTLLLMIVAGIGFSLMPLGDVDAATPLPPTLTPYPTPDASTMPEEQIELAHNIHDAIWWECAPVPDGSPLTCYTPNPKPGLALYTIQGYRSLYDMGVFKVFNSGIVLSVAIFVFLRLIKRIRNLVRGDISSVDVSGTVGIDLRTYNVDDYLKSLTKKSK